MCSLNIHPLCKLIRMDDATAYVIVHLQEILMTFYGYKSINHCINCNENTTRKLSKWYRGWFDIVGLTRVSSACHFNPLQTGLF